MPRKAWKDIHYQYATTDWIDKPSIFAKSTIDFFPKNGRILELGAGQGQDSRFFASHGYEVISTDNSESALKLNRDKLPANLKAKVKISSLDIRKGLPFKDRSFDVVYAHLSLHYFDEDTTNQIFDAIWRILKDMGILAFLVNSIHDPEYKTGTTIQPDYFRIDVIDKRFFEAKTAVKFASRFGPLLADEKGETYKDRAKGVHNLVRFIGRKTK